MLVRVVGLCIYFNLRAQWLCFSMLALLYGQCYWIVAIIEVFASGDPLGGS